MIRVRGTRDAICIIVLAFLAMSAPMLLRAQMATADVLGTVTDPTGAVVADAKVTIRNTGTGAASAAVTSSTGEYLFSQLQIGTYKLTVEAKGFKTFAATGLTLAVGNRVRMDAKLEVGSQVETVEVTASAVVELQKDTSEVSSLIPAESVSEMPTNGRNYYSLLSLEPGIVSSSGPGDPTDARPVMAFSANGMNSEYNNNLIDGLDNNERSLGEVAIEPSLDALEEVKVETNMFSAEYSRTGGGVANLITKSGTNQFHGTLFEFMRNDDLDAYPWTLSAKLKNELRQNQFGGSFGGPILKNKTFFFGDYQGWRLIKGALVQQTVANQAEYTSLHGSGDITLADAWDYWQQNGLPEPNGGTGLIIPRSSVNPLGLAYLMEAPAPLASCDPLCPGTGYNWEGSQNQIQSANTYDGRVDYQFNDRNKLFGRYSYNNTQDTMTGGLSSPGGFPATAILAGDSHTYSPGTNVQADVIQNLALDYVHVFSTNTLFEAKASYLRSRLGTQSPNDSYWTLARLGLPCTQYYCYSSSFGDYGLPLMGFSPASPGTQYAGALAPYSGYTGEGGVLGYIENTFQYNGSLTLNRHAHSIKIGATLLRRQVTAPSSSFANVSFAPQETGNALGDALEGYMDSYGDRTVMIIPQPHYLMWEPSVYIQDDWRATRSLTLNLGVRYDIYTPWTEHDGQIANFDLNTDLIVSPDLLGAQHSSSTGNVKTDFRDISPRLGFAYSFNSNNIVLKNMVFRGGWGMSYFPANEAQQGSFELLNTPFLQGMGCGNPMYNPPGTAPCSSGNNFIPASVYANQPYGLPDGGFNLQYGLPTPNFTTAITQATTPADYASAVSGSSFLPYDFKPGYQEMFSLQLQKQVANNVLTAGFVGNQGRRIPTIQNLNQPISSSPTASFPLASSAPWMAGVSIGEALPSANSLWLAGEATYARKLTHGLSANINYTWSRWSGEDTGTSECVFDGCPMDTGNGSTVPVQGWQQYNYDGYTTHRAAGMVTYNVPYGQQLHGVLGAAAKGWTLNGTGYWQTGPWAEIHSAPGFSGFHGRGLSDFPDRVAGASLKGSHCASGTWFNTCAFKEQTQGTLGNAIGNQIEGPRTRDADLALGKIFSLYENLKLQFRAECFNFTNTPSYSSGTGPGHGPGPGASIAYTINAYDSNGIATTVGGFGSITSVSNDPREFQFGLKLVY